MVAIEVDVDEYLTDEDKRQIAADEFRKSVRADVARHDRYGRNGGSEVFLSNIAYGTYWKMLDEVLGEEGESAREIIRENVLGYIRKGTTYGVFRDRDLLGRADPSVAQKIVNETVLANRDVIERRVVSLLSEVSMSEIRARVHEQIDELLRDRGEVESWRSSRRQTK